MTGLRFELACSRSSKLTVGHCASSSLIASSEPKTLLDKASTCLRQLAIF
jgi:hypothetical protein